MPRPGPLRRRRVSGIRRSRAEARSRAGQTPREGGGEQSRGDRPEGQREDGVARPPRHGVPLGAVGVRPEGAGIHRERDPLGVADRSGQKRHDVAEPPRDRDERPPSAVRTAHAMRLTDHVELVPETGQEPERRERGVADPVGHPQLLHRGAHEVGTRRRQAGDQGEREDGRQPEPGGEADGEGSAVHRPAAQLPRHPGLVDARRVRPQREPETDDQGTERQHEEQDRRQAPRERDAHQQHGVRESEEGRRGRGVPHEDEQRGGGQWCSELGERVEAVEEADSGCLDPPRVRIDRAARRRRHGQGPGVGHSAPPAACGAGAACGPRS